MLRVINPLVAALVIAPAGVAAQQPSVLRGQVYTADGGGVAEMRAYVAGVTGDTALVSVAGDFQLALNAPAAHRLELVVEPLPNAAASYHPVLALLDSIPTEQVVRVVLVPTRWTIPGGTHAGRTVDISLDRAYTPACHGCPSFFRQGVPRAPDHRLVNPESWPAAAFPLRVAFDRVHSRLPITARDSANFWGIVAAMERDFGERLFRPIAYARSFGEEGEDVDDVVLVSLEPAIRGVGYGSSVSQNGDIFYGAVRIRGAQQLQGAEGQRTVTHELMHTLGIGHTCRWRSVMSQLPVCATGASPGLTPEDVAYTQLLMRVRELQKAYGATVGIEAALEGERVLGRSP